MTPSNTPPQGPQGPNTPPPPNAPPPPTDIQQKREQRAQEAQEKHEASIARRKEAAERAAQNREKAHKRHTARGFCSAITKRDTFCKYRAVTEGENEFGEKVPLCDLHSRSAIEQKWLVEQAIRIRKQKQRKPHELMRAIIESNPIAFMQPYLDSLGIRIVMIPDEADPDVLHPTAVVDPNALGATLFGVSKDGQVVVSKHKDMEAQQRAAERLFDRVYGKPKQTNIIAGSEQGSDPDLVPFDERRQAEVAAILDAARRPSHAGWPGNDPNSNN